MKDKTIHRILHRVGVFVMAVVMVLSLSACSDNDYYTDYSAAYARVTANGGMDVSLTATLKIDGTTTNATGSLKVDDSGEKTILYFQANVDGETATQFSDGEYLYTDSRGDKVRYPLGKEPTRTQGDDAEGTENGEAPAFNTTAFLQEFASFLEAGKIQELGLLDPIPQNAVSGTTKNGDVYALSIKDSIVEAFVNALAGSVTEEGENAISVSNLSGFSYTAAQSGDYINSVTYSGTLTVSVPAALTSSGSEESYDLDFVITADFNDPGSKVSISLPSTDGYADV